MREKLTLIGGRLLRSKKGDPAGRPALFSRLQIKIEVEQNFATSVLLTGFYMIVVQILLHGAALY